MAYNKTVWENDKTPVNAENMNKIEQGISDAHDEIDALKLGGGGGSGVSTDAVKEIVEDVLKKNPPIYAETDPSVPTWAKSATKPTYTANEVGADPVGTALAKVGEHNVSGEAHSDLRLELKAISDRLNAFFDTDDSTLDELSEIVSYIRSNKTLIDAITTSKVSVEDIIDNLTTNVANKPLSAAQGVVLKGLIDALSAGKLDADKLQGILDEALESKLDKIPKISFDLSVVNNEVSYTLQSPLEKIVFETENPVYWHEFIYVNGNMIECYHNEPVSSHVLPDDLASEHGNFTGGDITWKAGAEIKIAGDSTTGAILRATVQLQDGYMKKSELPTIEDGEDGVSPTVSVAEIEGGHRITITDANGSKTVDVMDGADGYTPQKNIDYFTPTDKEELKEDIAKSIITQEAGESERLVMSQKAVTDLVNDALGENATTEYETVDSVEEMTDTSKQYVLSSTGTLWAYGEKEVAKEPENVFVPANATLNKRISSSGESTANGYYITEYLEFDASTASSPIVWLPTDVDLSKDNQRILMVDANQTVLSRWYVKANVTSSSYFYVGQESGRYYVDLSKDVTGATNSYYASTKYIRIGLSSGATTAITTDDIADVEILFEKDRGTTIEYQWYDTELAPSASGGGGGNYVDLLVKVNQNKSDIAEVSNRVTALETESETLTVPSFWQNAVDACISKIKALQVGRNCITFPFFSDNHQRNGYAGMLIAHIMKECNIPYCFFGGDSISNGTIADEATMIEQDKAFDTMMSYVPNGRMCRAVGNHDGYWYDGTNKYYYDRNQIYDLFLREESIAQNKHFGDDGTYYYIDDISSKVRFIVLNTNGGSVDSTQISWLQNTALSFNESGWAVVFISHQPISNHYHAGISNAEEVRTIVKNYIDGTSSNKADVVGWFSGHIHRDRIYSGVAMNTTDDTEGEAMGFKQVTITSDHTSIAYDDATKHTVANDDQSHAIDFVTINKNTRTVNLTRLGVGEDRAYSY